MTPPRTHLATELARKVQRHGLVVWIVNLTLGQVFASGGERQLQRTIADANLVLVRSQEMDSAGESGLLAVT